MIFGLSVPLSWLLWRAFSLRRAWWLTWARAEFAHHGNVYIVLASWAVTVFAVLGYLLGHRSDRIESDARNARDSNFALSELASTDGLTGLFNARYLHERLDQDLEAASERSPLTCLLIDIDHFKRINDSYGHPFGDVVLAEVAKILRRVVRRIDAVGRLGGEEFMILMPNTSTSPALVIADRIRRSVEEEPFEFQNNNVRVTVSLGVVTCPSDALSDKESMLKAVDEALYSAKRAGRNRIVVWENASAQA